MTKNKIICIKMFLVAFCAVSVNGMELGNVRGAINDIKANNTDIVLPAAKTSKSEGKSLSKIYVTPVTANWANAMLLKFIKGTDVNTVMSVLRKAGLQSETFADNGDGFYVRVDMENSLASQKAVLLSQYSVIESVRVNTTVYNLIKNSSGKMLKEAQPGALKDISDIMDTQKLPKGCSVYKNNYHSNDPWDDSLSLTITKNGKYMDMLLAEETVEYSLVKENKVFKYELISTDGPSHLWLDYRTKDVFEFHTDKNNKPVYLKMKKYQEVRNWLGGVSWKELDSMICK